MNGLVPEIWRFINACNNNNNNKFFPWQKSQQLAELYITVASHQIQSSSCMCSQGVIFEDELQIANIVKVD